MLNKLGATALGVSAFIAPVSLASSAHAATTPPVHQCNKVMTHKFDGVTYTAPVYVSSQVNHGAPTGCAIAYGSRSVYVKALQTELNTFAMVAHAPAAKVPETGYFGPKTKAAVKVFQTVMGLPTPNGVYDMTTANVLIMPLSWN